MRSIRNATSDPILARWTVFGRVVLTLLVPVVLLLTNVRLLLTPAFVQIEYRLPGFPADRFGFTQADRLRWAPIALDYLLNDAGTDFLGDLRFDSGEPVYNARELRHMDDVRIVTQTALRLWAACLATSALLIAGMMWAGRRWAVRQGLHDGARLTLVLIGVLAVGLVVAFQAVFVGFHRVFFEGDTWLFLYRDTLIRRFPERFWQDAFLFIAAATLAEAAILFLASRRRRGDPAAEAEG